MKTAIDEWATKRCSPSEGMNPKMLEELKEIVISKDVLREICNNRSILVKLKLKKLLNSEGKKLI